MLTKPSKTSITLESLSTSIDDLAIITKNGFSMVDKHFELVDKQFELIEKRLLAIEQEIRYTNARLDLIERDIADIPKRLINRDEFEEIIMRVETIEKRLGMNG